MGCEHFPACPTAYVIPVVASVTGSLTPVRPTHRLTRPLSQWCVHSGVDVHAAALLSDAGHRCCTPAVATAGCGFQAQAVATGCPPTSSLIMPALCERMRLKAWPCSGTAVVVGLEPEDDLWLRPVF